MKSTRKTTWTLLSGLAVAALTGLPFTVSADEAPPAGVNFSDIPAATDVETSQRYFEQRAQRLLEYVASQDPGKFEFKRGPAFVTVLLARLTLGQNIAESNDAILDPQTKVYSLSGSDFQRLAPLCVRKGDYDFALRALIPLVYHLQGKPEILWPATRTKIVYELLNQVGNDVRTSFSVGGGMCGTHEETENHILMTETSRYLTNQLLVKDWTEQGKKIPKSHDNQRNGMTEWMLKHLAGFMRRDFSEYNSHPYQVHSVLPIQNLYEFSEDERVKIAAKNVLDYLAAKYAISSLGLRRSVPFRRQEKYLNVSYLFDQDRESQRYFLLAGNYARLSETTPPYTVRSGMAQMLTTVTGNYRVPELILDAMISKQGLSYWQRQKHLGVEIYAGSSNYLISAGGVYVPMWGWGTRENDGLAVPTTLMPAAEGLDRKDFLRFDGHKKRSERNNTCVAPGFACGLNPVVPESIPESCQETQGNWTFIDFAKPECSKQWGIYVALYRDQCSRERCQDGGKSFGFLEVREASELSYTEFRNQVLALNADKKYLPNSTNVYKSTKALDIHFRPVPKNLEYSAITQVGQTIVPSRFSSWKLAEGELLQADSKGRMEFYHPRRGQRLIMDHSDPLHPTREIE